MLCHIDYYRGGFLGEGWSFSILYTKWTVLHPTPFHLADTDETPGLVPVSVNFRVSVSVPVSV